MQTKKCSKCGEVKAVSEFNKDKTKKDGVYSSCRCCNKEYYLNNKHKILGNMRKRAKTPKYKEKRKKYESRPEIKAKIKEYDTLRRARDRSKIIERMKEYNSRTEVQERRREWSKKEYVIKRRHKYQKDARLFLHDSYVKDLIVKQSDSILNHNDIHKELVELKRNNIILKRKIKDNGKKTTNL